jgi:glutathione synthase
VRLLVIADDVAGFALYGDTTYALMLEASRRGHEVWTCQVGDLGLEHGEAIATARLTRVSEAETAADAFAHDRVALAEPLARFDAVLMRKDPPLDVPYLHATWILERARGKTLLVNDPRGLRELNEHLAILDFPELIPPTIVTRSQARLRAFLDEQDGAIVVKPVDGFGGLGVFLVRAGDPNASSIFETSTMGGRIWTMAQRYLPAAVEGDKRILLIGGAPVGAVLRVPPAAEARGNLHVGGTARPAVIDATDRRIIAAVAPTLERFGQVFVGLDVIGGTLTEINITSPTGIRHMDRLTPGSNHAAPVLEWIERNATKAPARA